MKVKVNYKKELEINFKMSVYHHRMHQVIVKNTIKVCEEGLKRPPIFELQNRWETGEYGYVHPWTLLQYLSNYLMNQEPQIDYPDNVYFCGPYRGSGEVMPIHRGNPFSNLNGINSDLADKMRKWVKLMCIDAEELNANGGQPYMPWHIIRLILCRYREGIFTLVRKSGRFTANHVGCLVSHEEKEILKDTLGVETEYCVGTFYSRETTEWMIELFREKFLTGGCDVPLRAQVFGGLVICETWCKQCLDSINLSNPRGWVQYGSSNTHMIVAEPEPSVEPEQEIQSDDDKNRTAKEEIFIAQTLIDEKIRDSVPEGIYLELVASMKKIYENI
jgi:hypothetical protein